MAAVVVVAAGSSQRMVAAGEGGARKPLLLLDDRTLLEHACANLAAARTVGHVIVVGHPDDVGLLEELRTTSPSMAGVVAIVPGGAERTDSVRAGVAACPTDVQVIAVHDAARPLVDPDRVDAVVLAALEHGGALLGIPARDTLKWTEDGHRVARTLERRYVWAAHTPQAFRADAFRRVLEAAIGEGARATDDAALWERYEGPPELVEDLPTNFKVTTPPDLELARALLASRGGRA
ncbi:2-C-methyl-D-erythritol 4-phosphate cytidylyltransferase [Engelhardtia mirabilis]|uniref:2-C-methyl-D-erythritol 4-phosphate cytidylyltransferase n=1 Tax=Engelhardtia mirabilis TaxID=2528011 RepID=UPI003AF3C430